MSTKLVSIIIPVYNMGETLEQCIISVLKQDYENIEVILVDDGSTDNSLNVCKKLASTDERIRYYHTENKGAGPARNYGIDHANGEYAYFPDADDYIEPNAISRLVSATDDGTFDLVVFGFKIMTRSGKLLMTKEYKNEEFTGEQLRNSYSNCMHYIAQHAIQGAPWNKFFSLKTIKNNGVKYPDLRRHQDEAFIAKYMCYVEKVHFINDLLYTYYENEISDQWRKYPLDYIDAVIGLFKSRQETIMKWNAEDSKTHELIENEYLVKIVKALEISFSPKLKKTGISKKEYIRNISEKTKLQTLQISDMLPVYQRMVCRLTQKQKYNMVLLVIGSKIMLEGMGFAKIKRKVIG